jgi:hypothetical protein
MRGNYPWSATASTKRGNPILVMSNGGFGAHGKILTTLTERKLCGGDHATTDASIGAAFRGVSDGKARRMAICSFAPHRQATNTSGCFESIYGVKLAAMTIAKSSL